METVNLGEEGLCQVVSCNSYGKSNKVANLVRRSMTTQMVVLLFEADRLVMKSIEMSSHTWFGIGSGCSRPYGL